MDLPARPYTKAEKDPSFNFRVAVQLLRDMGADNGCTFIACPTHHHELLVAIETCKLEGLRFSLRNIAELASGEKTEKQRRFKSYRGFARLDAVLATIFAGCKRCVVETCTHPVPLLPNGNCAKCGVLVSSVPHLYNAERSFHPWGFCGTCGKDMTEAEYESGQSRCCKSQVITEEH